MTAPLSTFPVMVGPEEMIGQGAVLPYEPVYTAGVPTYALAPPVVDVTRSGGFAAPIALVQPDAYAPKAPNVSGKVLGTTGGIVLAPVPVTEDCGCNDGLKLPWWAWALVAIGVVAIFRRVT